MPSITFADMRVKENLHGILGKLPAGTTLVAVTKNQSMEKLHELYEAGWRIFGENRVQELLDKKKQLPDDIEWHLIGHLQTNKVKSIIGHTQLIHGVDSIKLMDELEKQSAARQTQTNILLQFHIAREESKFGFSTGNAQEVFKVPFAKKYPHLTVGGLMGMASLTAEEDEIAREFMLLKNLHKELLSVLPEATVLSMGMSGDYGIAIACGSNMIRVGSALFA
jgi:hypothetical protein